MSELLRLEQASFGYGRTPVIAGVELVVSSGDFLGLVGPNGAGKTTLFRGILGLLPPMGGRVVRGTPGLGYVPQRESLDPIFPLTVREVVEMGDRRRRSRRRGARSDLQRRSLELLERVGLRERAQVPFASLSGGQRQRALIARALLVEPSLLLLDEPTSGVDRRAQESILSILRELHADGIAILLVSHQLTLLGQEVDRALWVADGRVVEVRSEELSTPERLDSLYAGSSAGRAEP